MRLAIVGGGGFRVPLVYRALAADHASPRIDSVALYDIDGGRVATIASVLAEMATGAADAPTVTVATDLREALRGADFVFVAIRVGGLAGRVADEREALRLGLVGQETTGAGGVAFGLRTVPVAVALAREIRETCPAAWVVNFTNPAGIVTEAMGAVLGDRMIGVCDSPAGLVARAARAAGASGAVAAEYVGLNHLGWLLRLYDGDTDVVPGLLADDETLGRIEEARLIGLERVREIGAIPNEYLYFYYRPREAIAAIAAADATRGEHLADDQAAFYRRAAACGPGVATLWEQARRRRDASYLQELRDQEGSGARDEVDIDEGGYETIALALVDSLLRGRRRQLILNVRNGDTLPALPAAGVIEVTCTVDGAGATPLAPEAVSAHQIALMTEVKAVEELVIEAALARSKALARRALARHPLVNSPEVAARLLDAYLAHIPALAAALPH